MSTTADPEAGTRTGPSQERDVKRCSHLTSGSLEALFAPYGVHVRWVEAGVDIPGTFWGEPEAGIIGNTLWLRPDTPVHSALHEGGHLVCAGAERRPTIHTDAGGDFAEEDAVCYLQILLADRLPEMGRARMMEDMDTWGYTFRLGSARAWFEEDAEDALAGLVERGLVADGELVVGDDPAAGHPDAQAAPGASGTTGGNAQADVGC